MRRAKTDLPISPKLLKHFAAATVAITLCLAIFSEGSTTDAVRQTIKHNEVKRTEVDLLGARKLVANGMKVAPMRTMPYDDPPLEEQHVGTAVAIQPSNQQRMGSPMPLPSQFARPEDMLPERQAALKARKQAHPRELTAQEIAALKEASRIRSGAEGVE